MWSLVAVRAPSFWDPLRNHRTEAARTLPTVQLSRQSCHNSGCRLQLHLRSTTLVADFSFTYDLVVAISNE